MTPPSVLAPESQPTALPDHTQLPEKDGSFVRNFQEPPQAEMLTGSLKPRLDEVHPDGQYCIGCDSGIYWRYTEPVLDGCKAPDWFYVPGVPPLLNGVVRRSYVLWHEAVHPAIVVEFVSGDGSEERDTTPYRGKLWVYERAICAGYYAIFEVEKPGVEVHKLEGGRYCQVEANPAGRYPIATLGIELGIWHGTFRGQELPWLRVWDAATGQLLPNTEEREASALYQAEQQRQRAETAEALRDEWQRMLHQEVERAEQERKRAEALAARLRELGIDPDTA
jgi:Uma2 family endonuclease